MANSATMTDISKKVTLEQVSCIQYLVRFRQKNDEDKNKNVKAMIDLDSEVNAMHSIYATKLGFRTKKIDVGIQKIDKSYLDTFGMVIADCLVKDKLGKV